MDGHGSQQQIQTTLEEGFGLDEFLVFHPNLNNPDKAWEVISYITSKKVSKKALESKETINDPFRYSHFSSIGKGAFPTKEMNEDLLNTVQRSLENPNADLMISGGWEYMQILDQNIYLALIHKLTPEEAITKNRRRMEYITESYGRSEQARQYKEWLNLLKELKNMKWRNSLVFHIWIAINSIVLTGVLTISAIYLWRESISP